jgi:hypothetical protein
MKNALDVIRYAAAGAALFSALGNVAFTLNTTQNWVAAAIGSAAMLALVKARHMI